MCGILILLNGQAVDVGRLKTLLRLINNRGPDYDSPLISHRCGQIEFKIKSSVLHLRGDVIQKQPVIDDDLNVLMFNGQIYAFGGYTLDQTQSDTSFLAKELGTCTSSLEIATVFSRIEGPFAFIYWHNKTNTITYGRDIFGRKSLCSLDQKDSDVPIILSSVVDEDLETCDRRWSEVSCIGLHSIDFSDMNLPQRYTFCWDIDRVYHRTTKCQGRISNHLMGGIISTQLCPLNGDLKQSEEYSKESIQEALENLESRFLRAVESRFVYNNKKCLTCRRSQAAQCNHAKVAVAFSGGVDSTIIALALDKIIHPEESIDLVTVAFKPESPDRTSVASAYMELIKISPNRNWRLILCDIALSELQQMRQQKIRNLILPCESVFDDGIGCACWFVSRATGRMIERAKCQEWLADNFEAFIRYDPNSSCVDEQNVFEYTSPASMLYAGSSIDEQLGGYSSHRAAWSKQGIKGLLDEVSFLMRRLSSRNLGRDDRTYCDHGRDLKLPFLDFEFISYLNQLPIGIKMNLDESPDIGPKKILRLLALKWGLIASGKRVKRAMQFGTRIANLENNKEKGNDVCVRLRGDNEKLLDDVS